MMNIDTPLTPPADQHDDDHEIHKPSVKFDLSNLPTMNKDQKQQEQAPPSPCIDICAHMVPSTILVALLDREQEMRGLVRHNMPFFETLQLHLGPTQWPLFEDILYRDRQQLSDKEWMSRIEQFLNQVPSLLGTFKELVGYVDDSNDQERNTTAGLSITGVPNVDLCHIRQYPDRLKDLHSSYPQFFINCQQVLSEDDYTQMENVLFASKSELSDGRWKSLIKKLLSPHQNLMDQLKEIIAYEIDDD
ncbi:uncharacterized protein BX664DRAFT_282719 [Halteromyces radiatus]|uniref:uncharacterized protein n=1 Tax=Halteromyces radiatus TaxID=101107 RepID=UPI00221EC9F8|nr:uncharacterized protein BX664DRAFT_282719 [Halteromyces radiatus]KAI8086632.1 hypothetical protein BX664DRAFT_282719 [Halteromyces radiatus]